MNEVLADDGVVRLAAFLAAGALLLLLQWRFGLRGDGRPAHRQVVNVSIGVIDTLVLRFGFPVLAVAWAAEVHTDGGGLLGALTWHPAVEFLLAVLVLDLVIYWQHRLMHRIPRLWRLHRVHHADRGFDVTTAVRFHPREIALSMGLKLGVITLLGPSALAVLTSELMLSLGALWTHTDIVLPKPLDRAARWLIVTPSMHRIHHSTWQPETDSKYGFQLSIRDRLFRSYRSQPRKSERDMPIGLDEYMDDREQGLLALLSNPFRRVTNRKTTFKKSQTDSRLMAEIRFWKLLMPRHDCRILRQAARTLLRISGAPEKPCTKAEPTITIKSNPTIV